MNKHIIIGNLTRDPEMTDYDGIACCNFTVAINRRVKPGGHPQADYIRVSVWRGLATICYNNLHKGRKVCCVGTSRAYGYIDQHGDARARIEMNADEVQFLDARHRSTSDENDEFIEVSDDELPFGND